MKKIIKFVYTFIIIGLESLGNMSAISAVLEENLIRKNKYINEEDLIDAITISRLGPGATSANVVAFIGNKIAGFWGGALATLCYTIAPLIVIILIYNVIEKVLYIDAVKSMLRGSLVALSILFVESTFNIGKNVLTNKLNIYLFVITIILLFLFKISGVLLILMSVFIRYC